MNYTAIREDTVNPLIDKYGMDLTITRTVDVVGWVKSFDGGLGTYKWTNSVTGEVVYEEPSSRVTHISFRGIEVSYNQEDIDGTVIQQGDRRFYLTGSEAPKVGDALRLSVTEEIVKIQKVTPVAPAGEVLLWKVNTRE